MSFIFKCSQCGTELEAQDEWEGKDSRCPICQSAIKISKPVQVIQVQSSALQIRTAFQPQTVRGEKFPFVCPVCGTFAELNSRLLGKRYTCAACCETVIATEAKEKECPFCREKIKFNASVCRYCQQPLPQNGTIPNAPPSYNSGMNMGNDMPKSRIVYILLGVFLGTIGIHDFYAGYTNKGIVKIVITVAVLLIGWMISGIWAIIDICTIKEDANGIPFTN